MELEGVERLLYSIIGLLYSIYIIYIIIFIHKEIRQKKKHLEKHFLNVSSVSQDMKILTSLTNRVCNKLTIHGDRDQGAIWTRNKCYGS